MQSTQIPHHTHEADNIRPVFLNTHKNSYDKIYSFLSQKELSAELLLRDNYSNKQLKEPQLS